MIKELRKIRGKSTLLDKFLNQSFELYKKYLNLFQSGERVHRTSSGFKMKIDVTESTPMLGRKLGTYEEKITEFIESNLDEGEIYVDVGANKGYHVLMAGRKVGPEGEVIAFEPNPENLTDLKENIDLNNLENIQVVPKALSDKEGTVDFYLGDMSGTGSIKNQNKAPELTVETTKFDKFLNKCQIIEKNIQVLKIDVEGAEIEVLEGMRSFLQNNTVNIALEFHESEIPEEKFITKVDELDLEIKNKEDNFYFLES